jgi:hypothetical protein
MANFGSPLVIARARLFVVSYAALWLIFASRFGAAKRWEIAVAFGAVGVWGLVDCWRLLRGARKRSKSVLTVSELVSQGGSVSSYLATYLLPFLGNLPQGAGDWIAYLLYFAVALIVYVKSDLALINPTVYVFGWQIFHGKLGSKSGLIVSNAELANNDEVLVSEFAGVYVIHSVQKADEQ